jgi:hypothetical protein
MMAMVTTIKMTMEMMTKPEIDENSECTAAAALLRRRRR